MPIGRSRCASHTVGSAVASCLPLGSRSWPPAKGWVETSRNAVLTGFEPAASALTGRRALQTAPQDLEYCSACAPPPVRSASLTPRDDCSACAPPPCGGFADASC